MITNADFPGIFQAADAAATGAQRSYARLIALDLSVMILAGIIGAFQPSDHSTQLLMNVFSAAFIAISLVLTFVLRSEHVSGAWYKARAIAESVKTHTWRYMMRVEPYAGAADIESTDRLFRANVDALLAGRGRIAARFPAELLATPHITGTMHSTRDLPLDKRRDLYLETRVSDQRLWYGKKAEHNRVSASRFFGLVITCQLLALLAAMWLIYKPGVTINPTGVFASIAAALIAWTQLKKHDELAAVYGSTAVELRSVQDDGAAVTTEAMLSELVTSAENVIARENALWLARRQTE